MCTSLGEAHGAWFEFKFSFAFNVCNPILHSWHIQSPDDTMAGGVTLPKRQ